MKNYIPGWLYDRLNFHIKSRQDYKTYKHFAIFVGLLFVVTIVAFFTSASPKLMTGSGIEHIAPEDLEAMFISKSDSVKEPIKVENSDYIHAGADEKYPDKGYDADGWSLRGYMSSYEMSGKHCKTNDALVRFEQRKNKVRAAFADSIGRKALEICQNTSVPPSIVAAQAILESNYGTSRLKVLANNLFGHMYKGNLASRGINGYLEAFDKDKHGKSRSYRFRNYASVWWSLKHHVDMLEAAYKRHRIDADVAERERWMAALCKCKDTRMLAEHSKNASYLYAGACAWVAKDGKTSRYVNELRFIIRLHNLHKLDEQWQSK